MSDFVCKHCGSAEIYESGTVEASRSIDITPGPGGAGIVTKPGYDIETSDRNFMADGYECLGCLQTAGRVEDLVKPRGSDMCFCGHSADDHERGHFYAFKRYDGEKPRVLSPCRCCGCWDFELPPVGLQVAA